MTDHPINLDGCRSAAGQRQTQMRGRPANCPPLYALSSQPDLGSLENQMLTEPARTWLEVIEKWRFLLVRYASTLKAQDERVQKLIKRAPGDMERLRKREERK